MTTQSVALLLLLWTLRVANVHSLIIHSRRDAIASGLATLLLVDTKTTSSSTKHASEIMVQGSVTVPPDIVRRMEGGTPALYITCRPDRPNNVPTAILSGTRGKPPPVLAARFASDLTFPYTFQLTLDNVTLEGQDGWWTRDNLIVSARYDYDGVAVSRSPQDLVGQSRLDLATTSTTTIPLQGRGAFGTFATQKH